ncbi:MAG: hypothetical protein HY673_19615 [Chloroflexi bacterium]|nr:hypothetical protein [Chloroflexota bacterium]
MEYDIEGDLFRVRYRPPEVGPDRIRETIVGLGREKGLPYQVAVLGERWIS